MISRNTLLIIAVLLLTVGFSTGTSFGTPAIVDYGFTSDNCSALRAYVETLTDVAFGKPVKNVTTTWYDETSTLPSYCKVTGWMWPEIQFQVSLPSKWNNRYVNSGGGGWNGSLVGTLTSALALGYATSGSNGAYSATYWPQGLNNYYGSFGLKEPYFSQYYDNTVYPNGNGYDGDAFVPGLGNPNACQKIEDYGIRQLRETPLVSKKIIAHYYGSYPKYSYFNGGSNGGKEGMISSQKAYDIYDGFYIGFPLGGNIAITMRGMWDTLKGASLNAAFTTAKQQVLYASVYNKCDGVDGLVDGLIDDPRACNFDPIADITACTDDVDDGSGCFTLAERQALKEIYTGPHDSKGRKWYVGQTLSAEYMAPGWFGTISSGFTSALADFYSSGMFANIAMDPPKGPDFDITAFDWDKDPLKVQKTSCTQCYDDGTCKTINVHDTMDAITLSDKPVPNMGGYEPLRRKGGKIIQYHGWSDALVTGSISSAFYDTLLSKMGVQKVKSFYKLYMIPGMGHGLGSGISCAHSWADGFNALVDWVENGIEPGAFTGTRNANVDSNWPSARTRPVCLYPEVARWDGEGDIESMDSFSCVPPIHVEIDPKTVNLKNRGVFKAVITVPEGFNIKDWNINSLTCEGASNIKGAVVCKNAYVAQFKTADLSNVSTGNDVTLTVKGMFTRNGKNAKIQASDTVRVIAEKNRK